MPPLRSPFEGSFDIPGCYNPSGLLEPSRGGHKDLDNVFIGSNCNGRSCAIDKTRFGVVSSDGLGAVSTGGFDEIDLLVG